LIEAFNTWLNVPAEQLGIIAGLVKMLHAASLLSVHFHLCIYLVIYSGSLAWMILRMTHTCGGANRVSGLLDVRYIPDASFFAAAHKIYGVPQTINTATYVFFLAYEKLFALRNGATESPVKDIEATVTGMLSSG
jgi:geranylgeranyl diphosphate synthase, type III